MYRTGQRVRIMRDGLGRDRRVDGIHEEGTVERLEPVADGGPPVYLVMVTPYYGVYCTADMLEAVTHPLPG
jgi:hypothetical protein